MRPIGVTQIIFEQFQLNAKPGEKIECPFCGRKTFSIKSDDTLAKCFHPDCGKSIIPHKETCPYHGLYPILEEIYRDFHKELLRLKNLKNKNAYSYLVEERKVHPQVVFDSMLGAVPSEYYPAAEKFDRIITEMTGKEIDFIREAQRKLEDCLRERTGWLCFFYTDEYHQIVGIKFRKPYDKKFVYFKPFKEKAGVFNHGLFSPLTGQCYQEINANLLITEGEFNQLQLQSLMLKIGRDYVNACSIGGVANADFGTIQKISKHPIICFDNDRSGAGFSLIAKAQELMNTEAFTTPGEESDLDNFIRSFKDDSSLAFLELKKLIDNRKPYFRRFDGLKAEVKNLRQKQGSKDKRRDFEINEQVWQHIENDLDSRGCFYHDKNAGYIFLREDKNLIEIFEEAEALRLLLNRYGIVASENIFRYLVETLRTKAVDKGNAIQVQRFCHFNQDTFTLYLFNNAQQIYKITPEKIELVDNGTDGVLFLANPHYLPFSLEENIPEHDLLKEAIVEKINFAADGLSVEERRILFTYWFYGLFFLSLMPTRPILAFIGEKGSGKSMTLRMVGKLLFGPEFEVASVPEEEKDFDAAVSNLYFVALDNVDTRKSWLNDRLAIIATGGVITRRKLYTSNSLLEIPIRCFLALTARTPAFKRDDVADRLLIMRVERLANFGIEQELLGKVLSQRNLILSQVIRRIQNILKILRAEAGNYYSSTFRMADFAGFCLKIAKAEGREEEIKAIFAKLSNEQSNFTLEGEPIFELLSIWLDDEENTRRELSAAELCKEFSELAEENKLSFPYKGNPRGFAQRLSNLRSDLEKFFLVELRKGGKNLKRYRFQKRDGTENAN